MCMFYLLNTNLLGNVNPYPAAEITFDLCLVCFDFEGASKLLGVGENIFRVSNSFDPDETLNVSFGSKLFAFGPLVAIGRIRVKCKTYHSFNSICQIY